MSELESAKSKIAGNWHFSEATTGLIFVVVKDKSTQKQQRELTSLMELGDSMEKKETETEIRGEGEGEGLVLKWRREGS